MRWWLALSSSLLWGQGGRYWDSLFSWRSETVVYGEAPSIFGGTQTLRATFYFPEADGATQRPIIVLLFGGAYISGSRNDADITHIAKYFAVRGYVTATIDYRTGLTQPTATEWIRASIRAMHDLKAFIRYLKRTVVEQNNPYGIDTNRIYVGGSSAGAFTALHAAFLTSNEELAQIPQADTSYVTAQGGIEGNSGNAGYSSRFTAVFSLSGGILSTQWIHPNKVSAVIAMHGTGDATVPYKRGLLPLIFLPAEGGYNIDSVAAERGLYHALFSWVGAGHVPYGTQQSVNPTYMKDVEEFLRYHFYQWNHRFSTTLSEAKALPEENVYQVWTIDGRYVGEAAIKNLPPGIWVLCHPIGGCRRVHRF
ncbi:MAG: carboxylesterase family protein [Bacteroidia bacterium]|nr:carboxylesterase family protein [Bacteroidia bacterium]MCX7764432.1 carboxylesterase family protein [Bacteroidia bacterium]MDW8057295.1 alpha/beta hydrolase [Bacteroidia bacterium]